jgi:predicted phosphodiesterase
MQIFRARTRTLAPEAMQLARVVLLLACGCLVSGCAPIRQVEQVFSGTSMPAPRPWTHGAFDTAPDKFTFAVFSDLTGSERPEIFRIAMAQLSLLRPELIINVGDLIEGETDDRAELERQWNSFDERARTARAPVFYVGGNHDLAGEVGQAVWDERHGRRYYHFVYRNVLFLVLDTEDHTAQRTREIHQLRNQALARVRLEGWGAMSASEYAAQPEYKAGNIGPAQSLYFQQVLAEFPEVLWTFVFVHKAPWLRTDHANFFEIEAALSDRPYTLFHGHEHAYAHEQRRGRDYIRLATTGGVQLPSKGRSMDHVTLVTVDEAGVDIVNLLLSGILDKTGHIPLDGDAICFEADRCEKP